MSNNVFVDSSVLIEPLQNRKIEFYAGFVANTQNIYCINSIVISEYLYKYIGIQKLGSPITVRESHNITQLASHDKDFIEPCKAEGIELLSEIA